MQAIRPIFRALVPKSIENGSFKGAWTGALLSGKAILKRCYISRLRAGIHVIIVTMSPQIREIEDMLASAFPGFAEVTTRAVSSGIGARILN